ncbi:tyrosine-type recombinase/integrase [Aquimarina latercula]|uniref:tyrosine-type recombinase/integrase n=1 Tax=Aquimarina latercula TaxID=987 RepID=UPI0004006AE8|nr:hypothetical protein [Aquimarina latercula]
MKKKKLPTKKGKGMSVFCQMTNCKKNFGWTQKTENGKVIEPTCGLSNKKISQCKNLENHRYRIAIHVPGTAKKRVYKTLVSARYEEALIEGIEYRTEFIEELTGQQSINHEKIYLNYLFSAQIEYLNFLRNVNVPEHEKKERTDKYIKEQKKCLLLFNKSLTKNKINKKLITIEKITPTHVGFYHSYLLSDMSYSNSTYNKKMSSLSTFFDWAIDKYSIDKKNPFQNVQKRSEFVNKDSITKKEFDSLLKTITPEKGVVVSKSKKRNFNRNLYRPFLKDAIKLALHTGGRREEIVALRWNMIKEINNKPAFIHVNNFKVERMAGEATKDKVKPKIFPITEGLMQILIDLGYKNNINSNDYILSPDRTNLSTVSMMDLISKGFNHYYRQLNTERSLLFKCLRKTYLTYLEMAMKGDAKNLSSHSTDEILQKHYIDEKIVSTAVKKLNIFE